MNAVRSEGITPMNRQQQPARRMPGEQVPQLTAAMWSADRSVARREGAFRRAVESSGACR